MFRRIVYYYIFSNVLGLQRVQLDIGRRIRYGNSGVDIHCESQVLCALCLALADSERSSFGTRKERLGLSERLFYLGPMMRVPVAHVCSHNHLLRVHIDGRAFAIACCPIPVMTRSARGSDAGTPPCTGGGVEP
jgi:hypothetical protein